MDTTRKRTAFTLVELLVVITIIGILASLIVVAAVGALKKAQETRIKAELNQISDGFEEYKNKHTAYPPNAQTDAGGPLLELPVLNDLKRHLNQVAPRHREPPELIARLAGLTASGAPLPSGEHLAGGMTAGEAIVFWLGGFSNDPKYPISGEGGPSYLVSPTTPPIPVNQRYKADPISSRRWVFPFEVTRLAPRADDEYFNESTGRYIEYTVTINGVTQTRRINFWQYTPAKSQQPFLYFDTSRHPAGVVDATDSNVLSGPFDPPAATLPTLLGPNRQGLPVYALKRRSDTSQTKVPQIEFVNPEKFQVLHCGIDDAWGEDAFKQMSVETFNSNDPNQYLLFPSGPFTGDVADTVVNFATQTRLEDATP